MQNSNFTNLKFSFSIPCLLTKGTKLKISFFLSRGTLYTYFLTIKTRHLFRLLPSTFHSFFSLEFLFPLSLCNHFSFSTRTKISPPHELSLTNSKCGRSIQASEKFVSKPFYTFLDIFTYFIYTREAGRRENSGERKCSTANT